MRIVYLLSDYISHFGSGMEYASCLRSRGHSVTHDRNDLPEADVVILHEEPVLFPAMFDRDPVLRSKRAIGLCVWENELLPEAYRHGLSHVGEVWTPSRFSAASMAPYFPHVRVVPHVVRPRNPSSDKAERIAKLLGRRDGRFRFFSIVDGMNPRKNLAGLLAAFQLAYKRLGGEACLVLKQYRYALDLSAVPGVISITEDLDDDEMAALHMACDAYASAHRAEGWGLGLSEAMAYGRPVIATAYSGNMDFMDESNSLPVPYTMVPLSETMLRRMPVFEAHMRWAEVDVEKMAALMMRVAKGRIPVDLPGRARASIRRFSPERIAALMDALLREQPA